jgi:hypothetical protein
MPSVAITWAQRLKRVFHIDIERCEHCGGDVKIIAAIEEPAVIERILAHIEQRSRAPPINDTPNIAGR